jgi:hypothetical protein
MITARRADLSQWWIRKSLLIPRGDLCWNRIEPLCLPLHGGAAANRKNSSTLSKIQHFQEFSTKECDSDEKGADLIKLFNAGKSIDTGLQVVSHL